MPLDDHRGADVNKFTRDELRSLKRRAERALMSTSGPDWKRAYQDLYNAADVLDAMTARSEQEMTVNG